MFSRYSTTAGSDLRSYEKYLHSTWDQRSRLEPYKVMDFLSVEEYSSEWSCQFARQVSSFSQSARWPHHRWWHFRYRAGKSYDPTSNHGPSKGKRQNHVHCWRRKLYPGRTWNILLVSSILNVFVGCCSRNGLRWRNNQAYDASSLARPTNATRGGETRRESSSSHGTTCAGFSLSVRLPPWCCLFSTETVTEPSFQMCPRWYHGYSRRLRLRQDGDFSIAIEILQQWCHRLRWLWWTW